MVCITFDLCSKDGKGYKLQPTCCGLGIVSSARLGSRPSRKCPSGVEMCFIFNFLAVMLFYGTTENNIDIMTKKSRFFFMHNRSQLKQKNNIFESQWAQKGTNYKAWKFVNTELVLLWLNVVWTVFNGAKIYI